MRTKKFCDVGALWPAHSAQSTEYATHNAGTVSPTFSGQRGSAIWHGNPWLDVGLRSQRSEDENSGPVSSGGQRASGAGSANGSNVRTNRGRDAMGAPRFDQSVTSGSYLWWYVDAISDDGQYGLTIIAFVGSVFSPYYAQAIKRGNANANNHCALNVALYSRGGKRWTMTERSQQSIQRDATHFKIGPSHLHWNGNALEIHINELGAPLPFPVRGIVRVHPQALSTYSTALDDGGLHHWGPLEPCARFEVELNNPSLRWKGHAYLDSNEGAEPIDRPFREWDWSRATLSDGSTAIIYDVQQKQGKDRLLGLRFKPDGTHTEFTPPPRQVLPLTAWRIPRRMRSEGEQRVEIISMLEDTPFYERSVLQTKLFGEEVISVHETLNVPRLTTPIVQWMLKWRMPRFG